jgi:hypothetical protein
LTPVMVRFTPLLRALQGAAGTEKSAAAIVAEFAEARLDACTHYADAAETTGRLGVSRDECRDLLYVSLDGSIWHSLVVERGWSDERFAEWLGEWWVTQLVAA